MRKINHALLCASGFSCFPQSSLTGACLVTVYCSYAPNLATVLVFNRTDPAMAAADYIDTCLTPEQAITLDDLLTKALELRNGMRDEPREAVYTRLRGIPTTMPHLFAQRGARSVFIYMVNDADKFWELVAYCAKEADKVQATIRFFSTNAHKIDINDPTTLPITPSGWPLIPEYIESAWAVINAHACV